MDTNLNTLVLKPCFCGAEVFVVDSKITPGGTPWLNLQCRMCGAVIHTSLDYWQKRPLEDALQAKLEIATKRLRAVSRWIEISGRENEPLWKGIKLGNDEALKQLEGE